MNVSVEEKLYKIISSIQEMKNDFSLRLDKKIKSRIDERYQNFVKTTNAKLDMIYQKE